MPRIDPIDPQAAEGKARTLLEAVHKKFGMTPNLTATLAQSPAALEGYLGLSGALAAGSLGAKLREQIAVAVAGASGCGYCASAHTAIGKSVGLPDEELGANLRGSASDPTAQAALDFALAVVEHRGWVSDDDLRRVRDAGFGDGEITEIVANVAQNLFTNYFNHIARTEVDFPPVELPDHFAGVSSP